MLDIDVDSRCDILFVRLFGRLTRENSSKLNREMVSLLNNSFNFNVVINIQNLSYIDSYGMKIIRKCVNMFENSLLCVNPSQLNKIENFKFVTDEAEAISKINI